MALFSQRHTKGVHQNNKPRDHLTKESIILFHVIYYLADVFFHMLHAMNWMFWGGLCDSNDLHQLCIHATGHKQ